MTSQHPEQPMFAEDMTTLRKELVTPFYLRLLNGNFAYDMSRNPPGFDEELLNAIGLISDSQIATMLTVWEWPMRLTGAWFVGFGRRSRFIELIGERLLTSEGPFVGQGYCAALALIGGDKSRKFLRDYLATYLPLHGRFYDQDWAIGALAYLGDDQLAEWLEPTLWHEGDVALDPRREIEDFGLIMSVVQARGLVTSAN